MTTIRRKNQSNVSRRTIIQFRLLILMFFCFAAAIWILRGFKVGTEEEHLQRKSSDLLEMAVYDPEEESSKPSSSSIIEDIQHAKLHLISFQFSGFHQLSEKTQVVYDYETETKRDGTTSTPPYTAKGTFCRLDWYKHKQDPASVPMFKDLVANSPSCRRTMVQLDLYQAVSAAKSFDEKNQQSTLDTLPSKLQIMYPPKGIVFHESRCGSTLAANILAAFQPEQNRVYSESPPPVTAAKLFHPQYESQSIQLLQDVIYLMSRSDVPSEKHTFFKIQSVGVKSIHVFRKAFPDTPWIFLFREPVQVLMSHLKKQGTKYAVCLRSRNNPDLDFIQLLQDHPNKSHASPKDLSVEEFCALHLSTLCQKAVGEILDSKGKGIAVNYKGMQQRMVEDIIPRHFNLKKELSASSKSRVDKVGATYSKGREEIKKWRDDSQKKEEGAWPELERASELFLLPWYEQLQKLTTNPSISLTD